MAYGKLLAWLAKTVLPRLPAIQANSKRLIFAFWFIIILFPILVTSSGLHWWQQPWPYEITLAFVWGMAVFMTGLAIMYVFILSPMFLIGLRNGKIAFSGPEGVFKKFATIALPCLQVVIAIWCDTFVAGRSSRLLSEITLALYALFYVATVLVVLFQIKAGIRRAKQSAA